MVDEHVLKQFADQITAAVKAEMGAQFEKLRGELSNVRLEREHGDNTLAQRDLMHDERITAITAEHAKMTALVSKMHDDLNHGLAEIRQANSDHIREVREDLTRQINEESAELARRIGVMERGWTDVEGQTLPQRMTEVEKERQDEKTRRRTLLIVIGVISPILTALLTAWAIFAWGPTPPIGV